MVVMTQPDRQHDGPENQPRVLASSVTSADRSFRVAMTAAATTSLLVMALIAAFLVRDSLPALRSAGRSFFTVFEWGPDDDPARFGIASALFGTVAAALIALVIATPISVGTALFINEYVPRRWKRLLVTVVDLLAAIPSLIFGLWGLSVLQPALEGPARWLSDWVGFIPIFKTEVPIFGSSLFVCGIVLAIMIVPIITSISCAVMAEVPRHHCEAALALGGTKAGMVREVILPFSRGGLIGGSMLGLGRALGETIAVATILSNDFQIPRNILSPGGATIAATIANKFGEAGTNGRSALIAAGLVLFVVTLLVNVLARFVVRGSTKKNKPGKR
jgi:phosphate transport system permease protein